MKRIRTAFLYMAMMLCANTLTAFDLAKDGPAIEALKSGHMVKLALHDAPRPVLDAVFYDRDGGELRLGDFAGEVVFVNFWATWCAPCRKEMPSIQRMQAALADAGVRVLTIATGHNTLRAIDKFNAENGLDDLTVYLDPKSTLARDMGVLGLPVSLILDRDGMEIARLIGDAEWDDAAALDILRLIAGDAPKP